MTDRKASRLQAAAEAHRIAMRAGSTQAFEPIYGAYETANRILQSDFKKFVARWQEEERIAAAMGRVLEGPWYETDEAYKLMTERYERNMRRIAPLVEKKTTSLASAAARDGAAHSAELISIVQGSLVQPVTQIAAQVIQGPLAELLDVRAGLNAQAVKNVLTVAVARGQHPTVTARQLRAANDTAFQNSLTVAKTEQFRAYRAATLENYDQSPVVEKWRWFARLNDRTCVACWEMDGQEFDTDEMMDAHPNCSCVMLPVVSGVEYREPGADLFAELPEERQATILGPSSFAAYKDGAVSLTDLTARRESADWGASIGRNSLSNAVGPEKAAEYLAQARGARTV